MTDKIGVGALKPKIAIYAFTQTAHDLSPLVGGSRYVLHIPADQLPIPAKQFWSVTMYDSDVFLVPNPLDRYLINDRSDLHLNPTARSTSTSSPTQPIGPPAGAELAPLALRRRRLQAHLALLRARRGPGRNPRRHRLAAARGPALQRQGVFQQRRPLRS